MPDPGVEFWLHKTQTFLRHTQRGTMQANCNHSGGFSPLYRYRKPMTINRTTKPTTVTGRTYHSACMLSFLSFTADPLLFTAALPCRRPRPSLSICLCVPLAGRKHFRWNSCRTLAVSRTGKRPLRSRFPVLAPVVVWHGLAEGLVPHFYPMSRPRLPSGPVPLLNLATGAERASAIAQ